MDLFDALDYQSLLPRRIAKAASLALLLALAFYPPSRVWLIHQAEHHAQEISRSIVDVMPPDTNPAPATSRPAGARRTFDVTNEE